jgi:hypothetical protein
MSMTHRPLFTVVLALSLITTLTACSEKTPSTEATPAEAAAVDTTSAQPAAGAVTEESSSYEKGVPGGVKQRVSTLTAKVDAIDYEKRTLTLTGPAGKKIDMTVPAEAVNFPQIQKGDNVNVEYVEQVVISVKKPDGMPLEDGATTEISTAPEGNKPAVMVAGSQVTTATVTAIDVGAHTATLQFADGSSRVVNVRPDVELKAEQIGREVVFETSQYLMLTVEKAAQ